MLAERDWPADIVVAADESLIKNTALALGARLKVNRYDASEPVTRHVAGTLKVLHIPAQPVIAGRLDPHNASYVIAMLDRACDGCMNGEFAAMVTAPVQKSVLLDAGFEFSGHTEYLAARTRAALPVMLLQCDTLRVALVTTHLALKNVPSAITRERLLATLRIVHMDMQRLYSIDAPRVTVLGLNPHAGESGHLGREEIEVIEPVIRQLQAEGLNLTGPIPADTAFTPKFLANADVVVAMYHDQGLPVLKALGFGRAVNITLGLPILRTSVDHGTALSLARTGKADPSSLSKALELAIYLTRADAIHAAS